MLMFEPIKCFARFVFLIEVTELLIEFCSYAQNNTATLNFKIRIQKNAGKPAFFCVHLFCTHYVVEAVGIEPTSENPLTQLSPGAGYL